MTGLDLTSYWLFNLMLLRDIPKKKPSKPLLTCAQINNLDNQFEQKWSFS